jgi:hypothetical protein
MSVGACVPGFFYYLCKKVTWFTSFNNREWNVKQNCIRYFLTLLPVKCQARDEAPDLNTEDVLPGQDYHSLQGMMIKYKPMIEWWLIGEKPMKLGRKILLCSDVVHQESHRNRRLRGLKPVTNVLGYYMGNILIDSWCHWIFQLN